MILSLLIAGRSAAADAVAFYPSGSTEVASAAVDGWVPRPLTTLSGQIRSFDAQQLEILATGETEAQRIAVDHIVWVRAGWDDADASAGIRAYREGRYADAIGPLLEAVKRRPVVWRQQWLSALMASAAFETGRYPAAFELVSQLDRTDLPAPLIDCLPIAYTAAANDASASEAARPMLARPEPLTRLVAASVLLNGADAAAAERVLEQLSRDTDRPLVARLADVVLWRRTPPPQVAAAAEQWLSKIDRLPPSVASGPLVTAADRLEASGMAEQALELWLTVDLLGPEGGPRAALAQQRAAALLRSLGRGQRADAPEDAAP